MTEALAREHEWNLRRWRRRLDEPSGDSDHRPRRDVTIAAPRTWGTYHYGFDWAVTGSLE